MEKHIMGENGISYTLGEDGLYYPDLYLPEETEYPIGKYGMLRKSYLQEHRKGLYLELVLAGKLNEHLHLIDEECNQMMDRLVEQMKEKQGVTEVLPFYTLHASGKSGNHPAEAPSPSAHIVHY